MKFHESGTEKLALLNIINRSVGVHSQESKQLDSMINAYQTNTNMEGLWRVLNDEHGN